LNLSGLTAKYLQSERAFITFLLKSGDTALLPKNASAVEHLWVVLTDGDANNKAIAVNITTQQAHSETTVVLDKGDHSFVKHPSVAFYTDTRELDLQQIDALLARNPQDLVCQQHKSCSPQLLEKLRDGLLSSPNVSEKIKRRCAAEWRTP